MYWFRAPPIGCKRRGSYSAKCRVSASKHLQSAFYKTLPSKKNPSEKLCLYSKPIQAPSKNPSKKHFLLKNLLRNLLRSVRLHDPLGVQIASYRDTKGTSEDLPELLHRFYTFFGVASVCYRGSFGPSDPKSKTKIRK